MRALVLFLATGFMIAGATSVDMSLSYSQSPALNFEGATSSEDFASGGLKLGISELELIGAVKLSQIFNATYFDKAQYGYLDQSQVELYTAKNTAIDYAGTTQLSYQKSNYSGTLAATYPLQNNFVRKYGLDTTHALDFFNKTTFLGVSYRYLLEERPESYFLDFDFLVKKRPTKANAHELSVYYEQVLSEYLKFRLRPLYILRPEERPDAYGAEVLVGLAFLEGHFLKVKGSYVQEADTELKNERGRFSLLSAMLSWDYEINYSNLLNIYYSFQKESEDNPRNLNKRTLGLDSLGVAFQKKISSYTLQANVDLSRSNIQSTFWSAGFGVRKEL